MRLGYDNVQWQFAIEDTDIISYLVHRSKQAMLFGPLARNEANLLQAIPSIFTITFFLTFHLLSQGGSKKVPCLPWNMYFFFHKSGNSPLWNYRQVLGIFWADTLPDYWIYRFSDWCNHPAPVSGLHLSVTQRPVLYETNNGCNRAPTYIFLTIQLSHDDLSVSRFHLLQKKQKWEIAHQAKLKIHFARSLSYATDHILWTVYHASAPLAFNPISHCDAFLFPNSVRSIKKFSSKIEFDSYR